jgi:hypothetical protein
MKIDRCPHCGSILPTQTMPRAIENRLATGPATMDQIKRSARAINPKATDKAIYNALAMLTRYRRVKRCGYGIYESVA